MFKLRLKLLKWILAIGVIAMLSIVWIHNLVPHDLPPQHRRTIDQIQTLASLVAARVQVADVMLVDRRGSTRRHASGGD
jgi:hypothetical protein